MAEPTPGSAAGQLSGQEAAYVNYVETEEDIAPSTSQDSPPAPEDGALSDTGAKDVEASGKNQDLTQTTTRGKPPSTGSDAKYICLLLFIAVVVFAVIAGIIVVIFFFAAGFHEPIDGTSPPVTTSQPYEIGPVILTSSLTFDGLNFTDALNDRNSAYYRTVESSFTGAMNRIFLNSSFSDVHRGTSVTEFLPGSVRILFDVSFITAPEEISVSPELSQDQAEALVQNQVSSLFTSLIEAVSPVDEFFLNNDFREDSVEVIDVTVEIRRQATTIPTTTGDVTTQAATTPAVMEGTTQAAATIPAVMEGTTQADCFFCDDGSCKPPEFRCDTVVDCPDGEDEQNCTIVTCAENEFTCSVGECTLLANECNILPDCPQGEDEESCGWDQIGEDYNVTGNEIITIEEPSVYPINDISGFISAQFFRFVGQPGYALLINVTKTTIGPFSAVAVFEGLNLREIVAYFTLERRFSPNSNEPVFELVASSSTIVLLTIFGDVLDVEIQVSVGTFLPDCASDEFQCDNGFCINATSVCDRTLNCDNGEDEQGCATPCSQQEFQCNNGQCTSIQTTCNLFQECSDGEDEAICDWESVGETHYLTLEMKDLRIIRSPVVYPPTPFRGDGNIWLLHIIGVERYNLFVHVTGYDVGPNSFVTVYDGLDPTNPFAIIAFLLPTEFISPTDTLAFYTGGRTASVLHFREHGDVINMAYNFTIGLELPECEVNEFACNDSRCIPITFVCDEKQDCDDGEDELNCDDAECGVNEVQCGNTTSCTNILNQCNLFRDCPNAEDEQVCGWETFGEFFTVTENAPVSIAGTIPLPLVSPFPGPGQVQRYRFLGESGYTLCINVLSQTVGLNSFFVVVDGPDWTDMDSFIGYFFNSYFITPSNLLQFCTLTDQMSVGFLVLPNQTIEATFTVRRGDPIPECDGYKCSDGVCIVNSFVCDGTPDCSGGEDETNCPNATSGPGPACDGFECQDSTCLPASFQCDLFIQCQPFAEDETACGWESFGDTVTLTSGGQIVISTPQTFPPSNYSGNGDVQFWRILGPANHTLSFDILRLDLDLAQSSLSLGVGLVGPLDMTSIRFFSLDTSNLPPPINIGTNTGWIGVIRGAGDTFFDFAIIVSAFEPTV